LDVATLLKFAAWGVIVAVALQVIFYFVFQTIGYDSYLLSITLIVSVIIAILLLVGWKALKKAVT
jgi:high-affinity Fe2+/Pb2+ permease